MLRTVNLYASIINLFSLISSALSTTTAVSQWLQSAKSPRVLHLFDQVCNLVDAERRVISLVLPEIGKGPFSLVVDLANGRFPQLVTSQSHVSVDGFTLQIGALVVDTSKAVLWNARPLWETMSAAASKPYLPLFERKLAGASPESLAHVNDPFPRLSVRSKAIILKEQTAVRTLQEGIATNNVAVFRKGVSALVGLGAGLTPAGDDFLMGVSYGFWLTQEISDSDTKAQKYVEALREETAGRTTTLSGAWLEAAARGEAGQAWHELVQALTITSTSSVNTSTSSVNAVSQAIDHILATGHTSGADALAGFVMTIATP